MRLLGSLILPALLACTLCQNLAANPWAGVKGPANGTAQVLGKYTAGCMRGGVALSGQVEGLQIMRPQRQRYFGHPNLIDFVGELAAEADAQGWGDLMIGDLSMARGGPMPFGHASHQVGLDADVWFRTSKRQLSRAERVKASASTYVSRRTGKVVKHWGAAQVGMLRFAAEHPDVARIFVNPVIKRSLCESQENRGWLRKVRPWFGHHAHMHVRLRCPDDSPACVAQAAPPSGDGCGAELDAWFKPRETGKSGTKKKRKPRVLPAACASVLSAQ